MKIIFIFYDDKSYDEFIVFFLYEEKNIAKIAKKISSKYEIIMILTFY